MLHYQKRWIGTALFRGQRPEAPLFPQVYRRRLHLAPPFLLDSHVPRYQLLSTLQESEKRSQAYAHLKNCNLCPRRCGVDRNQTTGYCLIGSTATVNTIAPHFGEEPFFQGHNGSGSVFFSGCSLRCTFCQNHDISHTKAGFDLTPEQLGEWFIRLQDAGVHNINLVTPEHVVPQCVLAILHAKSLGLELPILYNTSSYDSIESIGLMEGLVDMYLPDFKLWNKDASKRLLKADDYAEVARESIKAMHQQAGDLCFTADGIAKTGVCVRHLVMPGKVSEAIEIMTWLAKEVSTDLFVHIMEQYHPRAHVGQPRRRSRTNLTSDGTSGPDVRYQEINRPIEDSEVDAVRKAAQEAGLWRFVDVAEHGGFNI